MLDRFTGQAKRVVVLAQEEARLLNHHEIGAEHLLLGLIRGGDGIAARALESLGVTLEAARQQVAEIAGRGQQASSGHIGFTPGAKKVLEASLFASRSHGADHIGTEHLLLGLTRERSGVAAQVLTNLGAGRPWVQWKVTQLLAGNPEEEPLGAPATPPPSGDPGQPPAGTVPMALVGVRVEMPSSSPMVVLKEAQGDRYLSIHIGAVEATAIALGQQGVQPARPLTHDLLCIVLEAMGVQLLTVTITARVAGIFYSDLSFSNHMTVSSRPSDAIALAVRAGTAILVSAGLLDEVGVAVPDDDTP